MSKAENKDPVSVFISQISNINTAAAYQRDLLQLKMYLEVRSTSFEEVTHTMAHAYFDWLFSTGIGIRTIRRKRSAIRRFYRFLLKCKRVQANPFACVDVPVEDREIEPHILCLEDVARCLDLLAREAQTACERSANHPMSRGLRRRQFYAIRRRAVVVMLVTTGMRLGELLNIRRSAIEAVNSCFQIKVIGPANKRRILPLETASLPALVDWLKTRNTISKTSDHLFIGYEGRPCSRMSIRQIMKWLQVRLETSHPLNAQLFRRSFIHWQLASHLDFLTLRDQLGLVHLARTPHYTPVIETNVPSSLISTPLAMTKTQNDLYV